VLLWKKNDFPTNKIVVLKSSEKSDIPTENTEGTQETLEAAEVNALLMNPDAFKREGVEDISSMSVVCQV
jgi:hypothetical protein